MVNQPMSNRRQQQKAETAQRIFEAALRLFREQGYGATTVEQIVQAAGVAKGTFFTHFPSKDALLDHIGAVQMGRIAAAIGGDPGFADRPTRARLHAVLRSMAVGFAAQPDEARALTFEIMARRSLFDVDPQNITALDRLLATIVAEGQARGELRDAAPAARVATLVRGAYFLGLFEWVQAPGLDLPALVAQYLDCVLDGIAPP
jgi:AcrR family transcriptional regulator